MTHLHTNMKVINNDFKKIKTNIYVLAYDLMCTDNKYIEVMCIFYSLCTYFILALPVNFNFQFFTKKKGEYVWTVVYLGVNTRKRDGVWYKRKYSTKYKYELAIFNAISLQFLFLALVLRLTHSIILSRMFIKHTACVSVNMECGAHDIN